MRVIFRCRLIVAPVVFCAERGDTNSDLGLHVPVVAEHECVAVRETGGNAVADKMAVFESEVEGCRSGLECYEVAGHRAVEPISQFGLNPEICGLDICNGNMGRVSYNTELERET